MLIQVHMNVYVASLGEHTAYAASLGGHTCHVVVVLPRSVDVAKGKPPCSVDAARRAQC